MSVRKNTRAATNPEVVCEEVVIPGLDLAQVVCASQRARKPKVLAQTELPLFTNKPYEMMATGAPVISATQAYIKQPEWHEYSPGKLYFQKRFGKGRYIEFFILNKQEQQPESITAHAEQEILERYGVMAARLHAIFATYASHQQRPWNEPFSLFGSDLIKILRLNSRKDITKPEKLKRISDLAWIVGTLGIAVYWHEGRLDLHIKRTSPVWTILYIEEYYQPKIPGFDRDNELYEVVIRIQPGTWTEKFLNQTGNQAGVALHQLGFIHEKFFNLNPYSQKQAVALALYILQNRRAHSNGKYRIITLLEAILSPDEIENIRGDRRKRSRFIKQFHKLLLALVDAQFQVTFGSSYPTEIRPTWAVLPNKALEKDLEEIAPSNRRAAPNSFETWLNSIVSITPPSAIEARIVGLENKKTKKAKAYSRSRSQKLSQSNPEVSITQSEIHSQPVAASFPSQVEITGCMVKQARQVLGFTQAHVASLVGKSVSWVKLIETGRRKIQTQDGEALRKILNL
ncbi:MAG: helix-turn-helix transcriptional regulator [Brasilonema octagenarum HA4186-MV1]|jgi:DNA-binding transcriptional regulator YiaG|nr:helix-turn-helix transcriptional regulator [Brasilonema octagenarum HA4186-MV1]